MAAKSAAERKRDQRERDAMEEGERLSRLLARRVTVDVFHATDAHLKAALERAGLDEAEDLLARIIHNLQSLDDVGFAQLTSLSRSKSQ